MNSEIWDHFKEDEVSEKIKYWVEIWDELIIHFTKNNYGLDLKNPHVVLSILIDEIENNELRNEDVKKYLRELIAKYLETDQVIRSERSVEFGLLLKAFQDKSLFYMLETAKWALSFFRDGSYFHKTYQNLVEVVSDPVWKPMEEELIKASSNTLIVELLTKGYSLKSIQKMPRSLFCDTGYVSNDFPGKLIWNDLNEMTKDERIAYFAQRDLELNELNVEKRLQAFTRYFERKPREHIVLFEIEGIKGDSVLELGPVTIYSPKIHSFVKKEETDDVPSAEAYKLHREQELFRGKSRDCFANVAVKSFFVDTDTGRIQAAEIADKALDLMHTRYQGRCKFKVVRDQYMILSSSGSVCCTGSSVGDESIQMKLMNSINLEEITKDDGGNKEMKAIADFVFRAKERQSPLAKKVSDCLHWFRKGQDSERMADRLLYYWIALEKIFTFPAATPSLIVSGGKTESKISLISELLPACVARSFIYHVGWTTRNYIINLVGDPRWKGLQKNRLDLPENLIKECFVDLSHKGEIHIRDFVENLPKLSQAISGKLVKSRVDSAIMFYQDGNFAKTEIEQSMERARMDIMLIYRYRNSIVHNAHYDSTLLQPFVEKASSLAATALGLIMGAEAEGADRTVEELFVARHFEMHRILERLKKKLPVDFLEIPTWNNPIS